MRAFDHSTSTMSFSAQIGGSHLTRQLTGFSDALGDQGPATQSPAYAQPRSAVNSFFDLDSSTPRGPFEVRVAGITDPGVAGKQNQDDFFLWESEDRRCMIAAVFDGHGRELGQVAAKVAKSALREELARPETIAALRRDPGRTLEGAFARAHAAIEATFAAHYEQQGWLVEKSPDGYLTRSRTRGGGFMCVHGGTTATVVIVLDGRRLVTANVGDSTALLVGLGPLAQPRPAHEWTPLPEPRTPPPPARSGCSSVSTTAGGGGERSGLTPVVAGIAFDPASGDAAMGLGLGLGGGHSSRSSRSDGSGGEACAAPGGGPDPFQLGSPLLAVGGGGEGGVALSAAAAAVTGVLSSRVSMAASTASCVTSSTLSTGSAGSGAFSASVGSAVSVGSVDGPLSASDFGSGASPALRAILPRDFQCVPVPPASCRSYVEVSADHSPESVDEFRRMHAFRPHRVSPHQPELLFVYDTLSPSKLGCPAIFGVDPQSGRAAKTERGSYYKNVRCEWATLVATPPHAPFQDALAFTRSLGDFHLQTYGVSHTPEVWWVDLTAPPAATGAAAGGVPLTPLVPHPIALVLASDGIWDNWQFEEVATFVLAERMIGDVVMSNSAAGAAGELMTANLARARTNFGDSADNMTALVAYFLPRA